MEPRKEEQETTKSPGQKGQEKKRRFQIVKLEERIAPGRRGTNKGCGSQGDTIGSGSIY